MRAKSLERHLPYHAAVQSFTVERTKIFSKEAWISRHFSKIPPGFQCVVLGTPRPGEKR